MSVIKRINIRPDTIEEVYGLYRKDALLVNRKYQRKLVWTVEEKEAFIDSISKDYPVPLILVALSKHKGEDVYEIIDGMQRLNSIVSFIENEFPLAGKYFNLDAISTTKILKDTGKLFQKTPALDLQVSSDIVSYRIPLSISAPEDPTKIEDIFRRINSSGRQLSSQELRQAGASGEFPLIVRNLAEIIRGDVSHSDKLLLSEMKTISINNKKLDYGITLNDIFWQKHGILTQANIRASRDEEIIAHLVSSMVLNHQINTSSTALDRLYGLSENGDDFSIDQKIKRFGGFDFIVNQFEAVFDELRKTLEKSNSKFSSLLFKKEALYLNRAYQIIFLAFYDLLVKQEKLISNYEALARTLNGLGDTEITPKIDNLRVAKHQKRCIEGICGIIGKHFTKRTELDPILSNGVIKLETLLSRSKTENTCYDFKQGLHQMDKPSIKIYDKVIETLTSIVNQGKGSVGFVVIGVADKKEIADNYQKFYSSKPYPFESFYITGLDDECKAAGYKNLDEYRTKFEQFIDASDIAPAYYKTQILKNIDLFSYYDKTVILLKIEASDDPVKYKGSFFQREGTSTKIVNPDQERQLWKLFLT